MPDSIADLGLRVDSSSVGAAVTALDRLTPAAIKAQQATDALVKASVSASIRQRDEATALIANTQALIAQTQARLKLQEAAWVAADTVRKESLAKANMTQLENYETRLKQQLIKQTRDLAAAQDAAATATQRYQSVQTQTNAVMQTAAAQSQNQINAQFGIGGGGDSAQRAKDIDAYGKSLDTLRAKFNPIFALSKQYENALNEISAAQKVGAISSTEAAAAMENERLRFEQSALTASKAAGGISTATHNIDTHAMAAFHSVRSMVEGFAVGNPPTMIFAQQIGQLSYAMSGPGGLTGAANSVINMFKQLLSGTTVLIGGVIAVAAAVSYVAYQAIAAQKQLEASLYGTGRAAGVSAGQLNEMAMEAARVADISVSSSRSFAAQFASSGKISGDMIKDLTEIVRNYATTTRQDASDASKQLTQDFSDLVTGVDDLEKHLGALDPATKQYIHNLVESGRLQEAQKATLDAISPSLVNYKDNLTAVGRLWADYNAHLSTGLSLIQSFFDPTIQQQIAALQRKLRFAIPGLDDPAIALINQKLAQLVKVAGQQGENAGKAWHEQFAKQLAEQAQGISDKIVPEVSQINELVNERNRYISQQMAGWPGMNPQQVSQAERALDSIRGELDSLYNSQGKLVVQGERYLTQSQIQDRQNELSRQSIYAKTAAQRAQIAAEQQRLSQAMTALPIDEKNRQAQAAGRIAYEQTTKAINDQEQALSFATRSVLSQADAYINNDIPSLIATQAHYQAMTEAITQGIDVRRREQELIRQQIAERVNSLAQESNSLHNAVDANQAANEQIEKGVLGYDRLSNFVEVYQRNLVLSQLRTAAVATGNQALVQSLDDLIATYAKLTGQQEENDRRQAALGALNPYAQDITLLKELNQQLQAATINAQQYRAASSKTGLMSDYQDLTSKLGSANPFGVGANLFMQSFNEQIKNEEAVAMQAVEALHQQQLISDQQYADARVAIEQRANAAIITGASQLMSAQLAFGEQAFTSLAAGVGSLLGQTSTAYKVIFGIEKAFTIARASLAMEAAIAQAWALPWPENIPAIAAAVGAFGQILSAIGAIVAPSIQGHASGVVDISGPGNGTSDSILHRISSGESVMTASATRKNRNALIAMNAGVDFDQMLKGKSGGGSGVNIMVQHDGSTAIRYEKTSANEIRLIAKQVVREDAPTVVAASQHDDNGIMAKATKETIRAARLRR